MKAHLFFLGSCLSLTQSESPITKVVTLLKELKGRIDADEKTEQTVYNKYACWCETTTARKSEAIHQARDDIGADGAKVLELKAKIAVLTSEIEKATEDIGESEKSLAGLTRIRKTNHENYMAVKAESEQAIEALNNAVKVLAGAGTKHVLLQSPEFMSLYSTLNQVISLNNVSKKDLKLAQELVSKFEGPTADDGSGTYSPQSATIIGILKNMHSSFVEDLKEATETEKTQVENFEKASTSINNEIGLLQEKIAKKQIEHAEAGASLADTEQRLLDTTEQLNDDVKFFDITKAACTTKSEAWTTRQNLRIQELDGISNALSILTSEENRALFDKSIKPGVATFLQVDASRAPRNKAFKMVSRVALKSQSLRLAALAASIKTEHFTEVIKQIDKILEQMKKEGQTDIENRDNCKSDRHRLNEQNATDKHAVKVSEGKVAKNERIVEKNNALLEEVAKTKADLEKNLEELTTQRKEENGAFKEAKTDDETAIGVLDEVLTSLSAFYKTNAAFAQEPEFKVSEDQAPDATFSDKGHREGESKGIISILEMIQGDLKNEITNGIKDEEEAQKAFQEQRESINKLFDTLEKKKISLEQSNANRKEEIENENVNIEGKNAEIGATDEQLDALKKGCDWLIEKFTERADKRRTESVALQNAKGVLAGAEVSLITKHKFNDDQLPSLEFTSVSFLQKM